MTRKSGKEFLMELLARRRELIEAKRGGAGGQKNNRKFYSVKEKNGRAVIYVYHAAASKEDRELIKHNQIGNYTLTHKINADGRSKKIVPDLAVTPGQAVYDSGPYAFEENPGRYAELKVKLFGVDIDDDEEVRKAKNAKIKNTMRKRMEDMGSKTKPLSATEYFETAVETELQLKTGFSGGVGNPAEENKIRRIGIQFKPMTVKTAEGKTKLLLNGLAVKMAVGGSMTDERLSMMYGPDTISGADGKPSEGFWNFMIDSKEGGFKTILSKEYANEIVATAKHALREKSGRSAVKVFMFLNGLKLFERQLQEVGPDGWFAIGLRRDTKHSQYVPEQSTRNEINAEIRSLKRLIDSVIKYVDENALSPDEKKKWKTTQEKVPGFDIKEQKVTGIEHAMNDLISKSGAYKDDETMEREGIKKKKYKPLLQQKVEEIKTEKEGKEYLRKKLNHSFLVELAKLKRIVIQSDKVKDVEVYEFRYNNNEQLELYKLQEVEEGKLSDYLSYNTGNKQPIKARWEKMLLPEKLGSNHKTDFERLILTLGYSLAHSSITAQKTRDIITQSAEMVGAKTTAVYQSDIEQEYSPLNVKTMPSGAKNAISQLFDVVLNSTAKKMEQEVERPEIVSKYAASAVDEVRRFIEDPDFIEKTTMTSILAADKKAGSLFNNLSKVKDLKEELEALGVRVISKDSKLIPSAFKDSRVLGHLVDTLERSKRNECVFQNEKSDALAKQYDDLIGLLMEMKFSTDLTDDDKVVTNIAVPKFGAVEKKKREDKLRQFNNQAKQAEEWVETFKEEFDSKVRENVAIALDEAVGSVGENMGRALVEMISSTSALMFTKNTVAHDVMKDKMVGLAGAMMGKFFQSLTTHLKSSDFGSAIAATEVDKLDSYVKKVFSELGNSVVAAIAEEKSSETNIMGATQSNTEKKAALTETDYDGREKYLREEIGVIFKRGTEEAKGTENVSFKFYYPHDSIDVFKLQMDFHQDTFRDNKGKLDIGKLMKEIEKSLPTVLEHNDKVSGTKKKYSIDLDNLRRCIRNSVVVLGKTKAEATIRVVGDGIKGERETAIVKGFYFVP